MYQERYDSSVMLARKIEIELQPRCDWRQRAALEASGKNQISARVKYQQINLWMWKQVMWSYEQINAELMTAYSSCRQIMIVIQKTLSWKQRSPLRLEQGVLFNTSIFLKIYVKIRCRLICNIMSPPNLTTTLKLKTRNY